jgi:hypothetical protein
MKNRDYKIAVRTLAGRQGFEPQYKRFFSGERLSYLASLLGGGFGRSASLGLAAGGLSGLRSSLEGGGFNPPFFIPSYIG